MTDPLLEALLDTLDGLDIPVVGAPTVVPGEGATRVLVALPAAHVKVRALRRQGYTIAAATGGRTMVWSDTPRQETPDVQERTAASQRTGGQEGRGGTAHRHEGPAPDATAPAPELGDRPPLPHRRPLLVGDPPAPPGPWAIDDLTVEALIGRHPKRALWLSSASFRYGVAQLAGWLPYLVDAIAADAERQDQERAAAVELSRRTATSPAFLRDALGLRNRGDSGQDPDVP